MIELLRKQFRADMSDEEKLNMVREYLQIVVLKILYDKGCLGKLAFVGGTALRLLYDLRRFSEDLDFSLINAKGYDFAEINHQIERELKLLGLKVESKVKVENTVQNTFLKFSKLLKDLELSGFEEQKLSIKVEVDSNPPKGWKVENTLINKGYLINLQHFDLPSMYAGKLHACFFRKYTKGRDFYDLVWYLGKKIRPNFAQLNNAIKQTQGQDLGLNENNLREFAVKKLAKVDFNFVRKDVERFLEDKSELRLLDFEIIKNMLDKKILT